MSTTPADVVTTHTAVLVRPTTARLSKTLAGSITGSVGLLARPAFTAQMKSKASVQSVPALFLAASRSRRTSGESGLAASCAWANAHGKQTTTKQASTEAALAIWRPFCRLERLAPRTSRASGRSRRAPALRRGQKIPPSSEGIHVLDSQRRSLAGCEARVA